MFALDSDVMSFFRSSEQVRAEQAPYYLNLNPKGQEN